MAPYITIIVPFNNEEKNVEILYSQLKKTFETVNKSYEFIFIDDGSNDSTYSRISTICNRDNMVNAIKLVKNFGQAAALQSGIDFARGELLITMDGDLQHDPADMPKFIEKADLGYYFINGYKANSPDNLLTRRIPSVVAKKLIAFIFRLDLYDISSTFKAYRREVIKE